MFYCYDRSLPSAELREKERPFVPSRSTVESEIPAFDHAVIRKVVSKGKKHSPISFADGTKSDGDHKRVRRGEHTGERSHLDNEGEEA